MPQTFLLQIVETSRGALLCNITNVTPEFFVTGLHFSNSLSVSVSDAVTLTPALLKLSQKHTDAPLITLELGANLDAYKVVEGSDVYLDCRVKANPWHTLVYFTHNGVLVKPGPGVVLANQSLVLQRVSRKAAGDYVCLARNSLGEGFSDKLKLDVKYTPTCKSNHTTIIRAAIGEVVDID